MLAADALLHDLADLADRGPSAPECEASMLPLIFSKKSPKLSKLSNFKGRWHGVAGAAGEKGKSEVQGGGAVLPSGASTIMLSKTSSTFCRSTSVAFAKQRRRASWSIAISLYFEKPARIRSRRLQRSPYPSQKSSRASAGGKP